MSSVKSTSYYLKTLTYTLTNATRLKTTVCVDFYKQGDSINKAVI